MAVEYLTVNQSLNLNDGTTYILHEFDPGEPVREEAWIEPWSNDVGVLANFVDRKTKMTIDLELQATSLLGLQQAANAVRDVFANDAAQVAHSLDPARMGYDVYQCYPSPITHVYQHERAQFTARELLFIPQWIIEVWRSPYPLGSRHMVVL